MIRSCFAWIAETTPLRVSKLTVPTGVIIQAAIAVAVLALLAWFYAMRHPVTPASSTQTHRRERTTTATISADRLTDRR